MLLFLIEIARRVLKKVYRHKENERQYKLNVQATRKNPFKKWRDKRNPYNFSSQKKIASSLVEKKEEKVLSGNP